MQLNVLLNMLLSRLSILLKVFAFSVLFSLTGCSKNASESQERTPDTQAQQNESQNTKPTATDTKQNTVKKTNVNQNISPKQLYLNYLEDVQKMTDIAQFPYQTYLSARAVAEQQKSMASMGIDADLSFSVNDKPVELTKKTVTVNPELKKPGKMAAFVLKMWKASAKMLPPDTADDAVIDGDSATWEFKNTYPENGDDITTTVYYVNENGWKIDTIKSIQKSKDGSTTFTSQMF